MDHIGPQNPRPSAPDSSGFRNGVGADEWPEAWLVFGRPCRTCAWKSKANGQDMARRESWKFLVSWHVLASLSYFYIFLIIFYHLMISYASRLAQGEVYNITQSVTIYNDFFLIFFWIRFEQFSASLFSDVFSLLTLFVSLQASEILATTR